MSLSIRVGPMFSGKTTWLLAQCTNCADSGYRVLLVSSALDVRRETNRYGVISSHSSSFSHISPKIVQVQAERLADVVTAGFDAVGVDEAQFYPDLYYTVRSWVEERGLDVFVSGLDGDSNKEPFGDTLRLVPLCNSVEKMTSRCHMCAAEAKARGQRSTPYSFPAPFTLFLGGKKDQVCVAGVSRYVAVCRAHHSSGN